MNKKQFKQETDVSILRIFIYICEILFRNTQLY